MMEFLMAVKSSERTSHIPFLACRLLVGRLSEELVERMGAVATQCGAEFINLPDLSPDAARSALQQAVKRSLSGL
jgi:hypothetical protein